MSDQNNEPMESLAAQVARMNIGRIPQDEGGLSTSAASDTDMAMPLGCGDDDDDDMYAAAVPLDASDFQPLAAQAAATLGALTPDEVAAQQTKSRDLASIKERLRSRALEAKRKEAELLAGYLNKVDPYNPIDVDKALATLKSTPAKPGLGAKRVGAANPEVPVEKEGGWFSYLRSTFVAYKFEPIDRIEAGVLPAPLYRLKDLDLSPSGKGDTMTVKAGHHVASFGGLQMSTLTRFPQAHVYPAISHQIMKRDFIGASVSAKVRFTFPHPLDPENKVDIDIMPILAADEDQGSVHNTQIWVAYVGSEGLYIELRFDTDDSLRYVVVVVKRDEAYMMEGKQTGLGEVLLTPQEDALAKYILAGKAMDVYSLTSTHLLSPVAAQSAQFSLSRALTTIYAAYPKLQMSTLVGGQRAEPGMMKMLQAYAAGQTQQAEKRSALTRESGTVAAQRRGEKLAVHLKLQLDKEGAKEERIRNVLHTLQAVQVAFQHIFVGGPPTDGLEKVNQLWKAKLTGAQRLDAAHMQQEFLL